MHTLRQMNKSNLKHLKRLIMVMRTQEKSALCGVIHIGVGSFHFRRALLLTTVVLKVNISSDR